MVLTDPLPFVSIIIPFYNNHDELIQLVREIENQDYPSQKTEIICIDNGSDNKYLFNHEFRDSIVLLNEDHFLNSPYSARNRGIEHASGEVIVFIDANSVPKENWLSEGVRCLLDSQKDVVAGNVDFDLGENPSAANIVDSITSINMKKAVSERGVAYTANLFIKKNVLKKTGHFEEGTRSGGDVRWCMKAKKMGFEMGYCAISVVYKKPRNTGNLFRKKVRTGRGYFYTWILEKENPIWFYNFLRSLKPPSWGKIRSLNPDRREALEKRSRFCIWCTYYLLGVIEQISFMVEYLRYNLGSQRNIDHQNCKNNG